MIVVTGAMGFIGSGFVSYLNQKGFQDLLVVDDFYQWKKEKNLQGKRIYEWVHRDLFITFFEKIIVGIVHGNKGEAGLFDELLGY